MTTEIYIHNIHLSRRALYIYTTRRRQWEFILPAGSGKTVEAAAASQRSGGGKAVRIYAKGLPV